MFDRVDLKPNLVHLLCLCNFSIRDPRSRVRFRVTKTVLSSSIDFYRRVVATEDARGLLGTQSVLHDVKTLEPGMTFNMKQYPNALRFVKKFVRDKKLLYITPVDLDRLRELHAVNSFELTIFYRFALKRDSTDDPELSLPPRQTPVHNVFIVQSKQPVLVLYNPFQHVFKD